MKDESRSSDFEYADSAATRMLADGIDRLKRDGISLRSIGAELGYKQSVVLSHMASGRAPIPLDRAEAIALAFHLPVGEFVRAVAEQRHPNVDWDQVATHPAEETAHLAEEIEYITGRPAQDLSGAHRRIIREVVAEANPERRWLSVHELPVVETIRGACPFFIDDGLDPKSYAAIKRALK